MVVALSVPSASAISTKHCTGSYNGKPFCSYEEGDPSSKIIINAPHGGNLEPPTIPFDRNYGCLRSSDNTCDWSHTCDIKSTRCTAKVSKDSYTSEIATALWDELYSITG